ncbi:formate dehydrogenase subunit gamma [Emcibacter sp.]|uniref:formate dehydrogenase subunit gamma n=1 Tax=Emcibacter sp. TaxID=1979954 RepID=UPI002AA9546E|nr:formate dehydrogenase subunit gamma [Emcibacter sp.]
MQKSWDPQRADQIIANFADVKGGLIEALHALQEAFGYIDEQVYEPLAKTFNISRAEVYGVVSFYHDFHDHPTGKRVLKICQAEACQAMGSRELTKKTREILGIDFGETTKDGEVTLEPVYCLGNCAVSPNVMLDNRVYGRLTVERLKELLGEKQS